MTYNTSKSKALFERATRVMIEGGSSPSRGPANYGDYPLFIDHARGSRIWDADGNEYIDWMMAYGALPLGHAHLAGEHAGLHPHIGQGLGKGESPALDGAGQPVLLNRLQDVIDGAQDIRAVTAAAGLVAGGEQRQARQAGHRHAILPAAALGCPRAVTALVAGQPAHALFDGVFLPGRDFHKAVVGRVVPGLGLGIATRASSLPSGLK